MENASKALLMAGGVLIALLTVALLVAMFNQMGTFYSGEEDIQRDEQIAKFNLEYEAYNRDDVRGTELLSLINKVINYNERKSDEGTEGVDVGFEAISLEILGMNPSDFSADGTDAKLIKKSKYTINEFKVKVIKPLNDVISDFKGGESELIKLSKTITALDKPDENVYKYYEYVQFKRAHFKCTKTEYNNKTGRIIKMEFKFTGKFE